MTTQTTGRSPTGVGAAIQSKAVGVVASGLSAAVCGAASLALHLVPETQAQTSYATAASLVTTIVTIGIVAGVNWTHFGVLRQLMRAHRKLVLSSMGPLDDYEALVSHVVRGSIRSLVAPLLLENLALANLIAAALSPGKFAAVLAGVGAAGYTVAVVLLALVRRVHELIPDGAAWVRHLRFGQYPAEHVIETLDDLLPGIKAANESPEPGHISRFGRRAVVGVIAFAVSVTAGALQVSRNGLTGAELGSVSLSPTDPLQGLSIPNILGIPHRHETYAQFCHDKRYPWTIAPPKIARRLSALLVAPVTTTGADGVGGPGAGEAGCATPPITLRTRWGSETYEVSYLDLRVRSVAIVTAHGDALLYNGAARKVLRLLQEGHFVWSTRRLPVLSGDLYLLQVGGKGAHVLVRERETIPGRANYAEPYVYLDCPQVTAWQAAMRQRQAWLWPERDMSDGSLALHATSEGAVVATIRGHGRRSELSAAGRSSKFGCDPASTEELLKTLSTQ